MGKVADSSRKSNWIHVQIARFCKRWPETGFCAHRDGCTDPFVCSTIPVSLPGSIEEKLEEEKNKKKKRTNSECLDRRGPRPLAGTQSWIVPGGLRRRTMFGHEVLGCRNSGDIPLARASAQHQLLTHDIL